MEDLVLSCLESRVEDSRNLYARFLVGPFLKGDALTIATALRRVLLSSIESIGITALYIQGITHEFSTIVGVRESVLELSLNFQAIVLSYDKTFFQKKSFFDDLQIGYLQVQGPKVIYANHLKLPLGVKLVDPTQYIATVSKEGSIVLKFIIGKKKAFLHQNTGPESFFGNPARDLPITGKISKKNIVRAKKTCFYKKGSSIDWLPMKSSGKNILQRQTAAFTPRLLIKQRRSFTNARFSYKSPICVKSKTNPFANVTKQNRALLLPLQMQSSNFLRGFRSPSNKCKAPLCTCKGLGFCGSKASSITKSNNFRPFSFPGGDPKVIERKWVTNRRFVDASLPQKASPLQVQSGALQEDLYGLREQSESNGGSIPALHRKCIAKKGLQCTFGAKLRFPSGKESGKLRFHKNLALYKCKAELCKKICMGLGSRAKANFLGKENGKHKNIDLFAICFFRKQRRLFRNARFSYKSPIWTCMAPLLKKDTALLKKKNKVVKESDVKKKKILFFKNNDNVFKSNICLRNVIPLDFILTPVLKVNFVVEIDDEVLYLRQKVRERIILEVWTNGSIHPRQAVHDAALSLTDIFANFRSIYGAKS